MRLLYHRFPAQGIPNPKLWTFLFSTDHSSLILSHPHIQFHFPEILDVVKNLSNTQTPNKPYPNVFVVLGFDYIRGKRKIGCLCELSIFLIIRAHYITLIYLSHFTEYIGGCLSAESKSEEN